MSIKVCSIIVTFNRKDLLVKNIDAVVSQSYKSDILIIDNASTDGTEDLLLQRYDFDRLHITYYNTGVNIGGSGGFYTGLKLAHESGKYNYFWLMDDDGRPLGIDCLKVLIDAIPHFKELDILNSLVVCEDGNTLSFGLSDYTSKDLITDEYVVGYNNPFNGTLVPSALVSKIGLPHKEFFIGYDEVEYMARCKKNGGDTITITNSLYFHPQPQLNTYRFLGRTFVSIEGNWKDYYRLRNRIFYLKEYFGSFNAIKTGIKKVIGTFIFAKDGKIRKTKTVYHAVVDGYNGDFSVDDFHILKKYHKK